MCIKKLREEDIDVTGFWYNTNIHPYMEYKARRDTLKKYSEMINLDVIYKDEYGLREFTKNTINIFDNRCRYCYYSRLDEVARYAKENGYDAFCTSLLISPYQKHDLIKEVGEALEKKYGIKFYYYDFRPYFKEGREEAKRLGLYMQKYCGCVFSEEERYLNYIVKDKEKMSKIRLVKPSTMFQNEIKNYLIEKKREFTSVPHKIIAVACSIEHAEQIKQLYINHGYRAEVIHSKQTTEKQMETKNDVENHRLDVIIHVAMLGEGYDHIYLSVAAIFRPFRNELPYEQFIGRVLRAIPGEEVQKTEDNIADVVSHQDLQLADLWEKYKVEIQESEVIKHLQDENLVDEDGSSTQRTGDGSAGGIIPLGKAREGGSGRLKADAYLTTELIRKQKEEEKKQKEDIEELASLFKGMLGEEKDEDDYVERLKSHFFPMEGLKAVFRIDLVEEKSSLIIDINDSKLNCYRGTVEQADVTAKVKTAVFEQVLDGTKTFQSAFMSGELSAQGNFKILRNFDTIFRFQNI